MLIDLLRNKARQGTLVMVMSRSSWSYLIFQCWELVKLFVSSSSSKEWLKLHADSVLLWTLLSLLSFVSFFVKFFCLLLLCVRSISEPSRPYLFSNTLAPSAWDWKHRKDDESAKFGRDVSNFLEHALKSSIRSFWISSFEFPFSKSWTKIWTRLVMSSSWELRLLVLLWRLVKKLLK